MIYDVIIVGGGMVGASLAAALADTAFTIALIDATPLNTTDDPRLIALNHSSYCLLHNLSVWESLQAHAEAIHEIHVSDRGHFGMTRLQAQAVGLTALGFVVPAKYINAALNSAIANVPNITIFRPATLKSLQQAKDQTQIIIVTDEEELTLTGKLIIGADGTQSTVRRQLNIPAHTTDYQQSALVTVTDLQRQHHHVAYERFHTGGAIAMLPLRERSVATIWTDQAEVIQHLLQLDDTEFLVRLQEQFGYRLGRLIKTGKRHFYPLQQVAAEFIQQGNVLLLGNAAHTFHPIAAQGFNLALAEIAMLAECLTDNPAASDWSRYTTWQQQRQTHSGKLSHALPWLFAQDFLPVNIARSLGLLGMDIIPALKRRFVKKALGHNKTLPRLLQLPTTTE